MSDESEKPETDGGDDTRPALMDRAREDMRTRFRRARLTALPIVQAALGAAVAWWVATSPLVGHERPFFAPIAAVITLSGGLGQRLPRLIQLVGGVALGVLVGDLLIVWIGTGGVQIAVVVAMAMTVAVIVGSGAIIVTQAGASAVLVATLIPPTEGEVVNLDRFVDALVGGGVGLGVSLLLLPLNPVTSARKQIDPLLNTLAELLEDSAAALADNDRQAASRNLARARETQEAVDSMHTALEGANEVAKIAPVRWRKRGHLADYLDAAEPLDHLCRNIRVLCTCHRPVAPRRARAAGAATGASSARRGVAVAPDGSRQRRRTRREQDVRRGGCRDGDRGAGPDRWLRRTDRDRAGPVAGRRCTARDGNRTRRSAEDASRPARGARAV